MVHLPARAYETVERWRLVATSRQGQSRYARSADELYVWFVRFVGCIGGCAVMRLAGL